MSAPPALSVEVTIVMRFLRLGFGVLGSVTPPKLRARLRFGEGEES
jgi:hypothetical protein